jgi:hypothetical protein
MNSSYISKEENYHNWLFEDSFEKLDTYEKFLNWMSAEFILYLQDDIDDLTIYFPNGWFSVKNLITNYNDVQFKIEVKSKCLKRGTKIFNEIISVLMHIKILQS